MKQSIEDLSDFIIKNPEKEKILWSIYKYRYRTHASLKNDMKECKPRFFKHIIELKEAGLIEFIKKGSQSFYVIKNDKIISNLEKAWKITPSIDRKVPYTRPKPQGIKYCRSCYDHLAGYVGVGMIDALEKKKYLIKNQKNYEVTDLGWQWLAGIGIDPEDFKKRKTSFTRQCLDNTEKRHHLAGQLGASILNKLIEKKWLNRIGDSRVLEPTKKGKREFFEPLGVLL